MKKLISIIISATILIAMFSLGTIAFAGEHATMGTAKEYVVGETIKGTLDDKRVEFVKFTLNESGKLLFKAYGTAAYQIYFYQENSPEQFFYVDYVKENSNLGKAYINTYYNLLAGTYYFKLNNDSTNINDYSITTSFTSSNESFAESFDVNNNTVANADDIELCKNYNGMFGINDKDDYYKIFVTKGKYILKAKSSNKGVDAILLNSEGIKIENYFTQLNYNTGEYVCNETILLNTGVYYLRMYDYSGSNFYSFSLAPYKDKTTNNTATSVKPSTVKIKKVQSKKNSMVVCWNKVNNVNGYEVQIATDKKFKKNKKSYLILNANLNKKTLKKLKSNKKYFVRVSAYKNINGKKINGKWSIIKSVKIK
ncbi:MAG: hypothetical protein MR480_05335 [Eubacterium coprostanoligenes]|uniref:fibronectin type III domain-containing protein n=1 Tax=Eubacterium coprostanoligenes TaxID=290054 RepID=UPI002355351F|nr:fibronectin type III domain-containing protein [Eubacterium coprostanoligenes]MCI7265063.1 hypothetical protein [Eubacterium coprostanoligenes]